MINYPIFKTPVADILIKQQPLDFQVNEHIRFSPEGQGDHLYLYVKKINTNTEWVQRQLAQAAGISQKEVGYAGLKDRHAVTQQWFSVYAPNEKVVDFSALPENISITTMTRGQKKLKTAAAAGNEFIIRFAVDSADVDEIDLRLAFIKIHGMPNYFGEQRFGHGQKNLENLLALAAGKRFKPFQRGIFISAGRSYLFNQMLARRVQQETWNQWIPGDVALLNKTRSIFPLDEITEEKQQRLQAFDLHPALPLYGTGYASGDWPSDKLQREIEQTVCSENMAIVAALEKLKVENMPRASRVLPDSMQWQYAEGSMELSFSLPAGAYATTLLEQVFSISTSSDIS